MLIFVQNVNCKLLSLTWNGDILVICLCNGCCDRSSRPRSRVSDNTIASILSQLVFSGEGADDISSVVPPKHPDKWQYSFYPQVLFVCRGLPLVPVVLVTMGEIRCLDSE